MIDRLRDRHRPWCTTDWSFAFADFERQWFSFMRGHRDSRMARARYEQLESERRAREKD